MSPLEKGVLEQPPTPPSVPAAPLHDGGVLGESTTPSLTPTTPTDDQNGDNRSRGDGRTSPLGGGVCRSLKKMKMMMEKRKKNHQMKMRDRTQQVFLLSHNFETVK